MKRRHFLQLAGAGTALVAASVTGCASLNGGDSPVLPWHHAGSIYQEPVKRALSYAILAPNPHNRQPWLIDVDETQLSATLYCQLDRRLPQTDPFDRQILIGLGCFSELFRLAALEDGYALNTTWFPEGAPGERLDQRPVAHFQLRPTNAEKDPLFRQVLARRSNKEPFKMDQPVSNGVLQQLTALAPERTQATNDESHVAYIRSLTWKGHEIESYTARTAQESIDLMRIGNAEVAKEPDGIALSGTMMSTLKLFGVVSREKLADPNSTVFKQGMDRYQKLHEATPAFLWLISNGNSREQQLQAGIDYIRMNMKASELGVAVHPVSQTLQEYAEMSEVYREMHQTLGVQSPGRIQMLARLGYHNRPNPSPRWPLDTRLI